MTKEELGKKIAVIKNFPKEGILFRDITTILKDPAAFNQTINLIKEKSKGIKFNKIIGPESRGFILACPLAIQTKTAFVPARKPGKLPRDFISQSFDLEYGESSLEIHSEDIGPGDKILIVDDLLATGGTLWAITKMVEKLGAEVAGIIVLINLVNLNGKSKLKKYNLKWVLEY